MPASSHDETLRYARRQVEVHLSVGQKEQQVIEGQSPADQRTLGYLSGRCAIVEPYPFGEGGSQIVVILVFESLDELGQNRMLQAR